MTTPCINQDKIDNNSKLLKDLAYLGNKEFKTTLTSIVKNEERKQMLIELFAKKFMNFVSIAGKIVLLIGGVLAAIYTALRIGGWR